MRRHRITIAAALFVLGGLVPAAARAAEARLPVDSGSPAALVRTALESELGGPSEVRADLLQQALARDVNYAPARWQSGFVRWDDQWLTPEQVAQRAASDRLLAAYRQRRDAMVDRADDHRELAAWCQKHKLTAEARVHWTKVLEFEPDDSAALAGLGLEFYANQLLTKQQIEQQRKDDAEWLAKMRHWNPQLAKWRAAIQSGSAAQRAGALEKIRALSDPGAIASLELNFARNNQSTKSEELNLLLIEVVGRMQSPDATAVLLRRAVLSDSRDVRLAATEQLKKRPLYAYVPQLIFGMPDRIETRSECYITPDGWVGHSYVVFQRKWLEDVVTAYDFKCRGRDEANTEIHQKLSLVQGMQNSFDAFAQQAASQTEINRRIQEVLLLNTNFKYLEDRPGLLDQFADATESYTQSYGRYYDHPTTMLATQIAVRFSCFPPGTPVATVTGQLPIEKIRAGDRVLSQDVRTGELAYKTVQGVTLRPASRMIALGTSGADTTSGAETLSATRGHPFWVNGKGWLMAKELKIGDTLHTLKGAAVVDHLAESPAREAYNLVVSDFGTYFVGDQRILVHDNLPSQEPSVRVPGLVAASN